MGLSRDRGSSPVPFPEPLCGHAYCSCVIVTVVTRCDCHAQSPLPAFWPALLCVSFCPLPLLSDCVFMVFSPKADSVRWGKCLAHCYCICH